MATDSTAMSASETPAQSVEEFLASGGEITEVPAGESGEDPKDFNWNRSHYQVQRLSTLKRLKASSEPSSG